MRHRVVVWGTGFVGKMVIAELLEHPAYELVGVLVNDPAKVGRDVGELVGRPATGLLATDDAASVLAGPADAVAYFGPTAQYAAANVANMGQALRAGKNVVSTSMTPLVYHKWLPPREYDELERACREGGTSCFTTGIDPGFANDVMPMVLTGVAGRVDSVRIQEILDYQTYIGDFRGAMGIGAPPEHKGLLEHAGMLTYAWGSTVYMIADAMGVELDEVREVYEKWSTPEPIAYVNGTIAAGEVAAVRFEIQGMLRDEPRIVLEHCNRITEKAAPHWPRGRMYENDVYRVIVKGSPDIEQETAFRGHAGDSNAGGCLATGMRAIHAIPAVCAAAPGLVTALDLPLLAGRGNIR